jgi:hypothetical protein
VLGPYGSDSTRAVAEAAAGAIVWNHGAAADDVQRMPGVVSVPSPASRYLVAVARALEPGSRVAVVAAPGRFARFAREGLETERDLVDVADADAVLLCGPLEWELERLRALRTSGQVLAGVSAGLAAFPELLGADPEGILAPVQWHPDLGGPRGLRDYVAAQAYAAAVLAQQLADRPAAEVRRLRAKTFFGGFELDETGLQVGHRLSVVQWRGDRQELVA